MSTETKSLLHEHLRRARTAVLWKLEGLDGYAAHRPMTPTATNLAGLVKHLANVEAGYLGARFGRPFPEPMAWDLADSDPMADMWAAESTDVVRALYERACAHADLTIESLDLESGGRVAWWAPERREVTLGQVLVVVLAETARHAGHADVLRELLDGSAGVRPGSESLPEADERWWADYRAQVEAAALSWRT